MPRLEHLVRGEVKTLPGGCKLIEKSLDQIGQNPITDYVKSKLPNFKPEKGRLGEVDLNYPLVFLDLETTGLETPAIISIAYSILTKGGLKNYCVFAPNLRLEKEMIEYVFNLLREKDPRVLTFNGSSFDIPLISKRARQWAIRANGNPRESFADHVRTRHIDLYRASKDLFNLPQKARGYRSLQGVERILFQYERQDDLSGARIPQAYHRWMYHGDNVQEVKRIIDHNIMDTVTLLALMLKLVEK